MALATYADLKASVASWATKTSLSAQIPDFVAYAHQEICRRLRAPILYARAAVTINAETVAAPTRFLAAKRFYIDVSPRRILHLADSAQLIDLTMNVNQVDYPSHFAVEGVSTLAFAPLFSTTVTGQLLYYQAPAALVADGDSNTVYSRYPYLYLYGALEALFRYLEDDNNADRYGGEFNALIDSINREETRDAYRGPLLPTAATAVV